MRAGSQSCITEYRCHGSSPLRFVWLGRAMENTTLWLKFKEISLIYCEIYKNFHNSIFLKTKRKIPAIETVQSVKGIVRHFGKYTYSFPGGESGPVQT